MRDPHERQFFRMSRTGGPLVDEFDHIVGILIEEKKDDSEKRTALFTRVASFMKFIDKVLRDASKKRICTENDLPKYVVSIEKILDDGTQRLCGGAIIDKFHVITAAHCVYGYNTSQLFIRTHRMYKNLCHHEITENFVEKTKWHPRYKNSSARSHLYDIAVLKVTKAFDLDSKHVRILNLPSKNKREENSTIVRFTGFRRNYASCITFGSMLMPLKKCKKYRPVTATNSHVCTKPEDNVGYGWIDNDGGPLVDINNNIIGIRIRPKNSHKLPALYTKVAFFMRFIKKVLRRNY
ncbi:granzyme F-like [Copidosoma floridanum]|uniref:granzyme F-like n=1 Tax=Copidosoma floridanum TaxID=29053 RepID=UPI0006C9BDA3|nr:granzyme F-like [Copidosoma floridanum]